MQKDTVMDVSEIRFTQKSIKDTFSLGNPIVWTIYMLREKKITPYEIPRIRVALYNGYYKTIDNRRLYCFKHSDIKQIPVILMAKVTQEFQYKDQSPNQGRSVKIVHDPKPKSHHSNIVRAYNLKTNQTRKWTVKYIINETKKLKLNIGQKCTVTLKSVKLNKDKSSHAFYCDICDASMSKHDSKYHLMGQRHQANELEYELKQQNSQNSETNDSNQKSNIFYCKICVKWMKLHGKESHLQGKKHKKKVQKHQKNKLKYELKNANAFYCDLCNKKMSVHDKPHHLNGQGHQQTLKLQAQPTQKSNKPIAITGSSKRYYCHVCKTNMSNYDKKYHLQGKMHKKNAKLQSETAKSSNKSDKLNKDKLSHAFYCDICDASMSKHDSKYHLMGQKHQANELEYELKQQNSQNSETNDSNQKSNIFYCKICVKSMKLHRKESHLQGKKHEKNVQKYQKNKLRDELKQGNSCNKNANAFHCDLCNKKMSVHDKPHHLNGQRHQKKLKLQAQQTQCSNKPIAISGSSKLYYCHVCKTNMSNYDKKYHLQGKMHKKNAKLQSETAKSSNKSDKLNKDKLSHAFYCDICDASMSKHDSKYHLMGQRHQANELEWCSCLEIKDVVTKEQILQFTTDYENDLLSSPKRKNNNDISDDHSSNATNENDIITQKKDINDFQAIPSAGNIEDKPLSGLSVSHNGSSHAANNANISQCESKNDNKNNNDSKSKNSDSNMELELSECEQWNPYFKKGCNKCCGNQHLLEPVYIKYCAQINQQNPPTNEAREAFSVALCEFNKHNITDAIQILKDLLVDYPLNQTYHQHIARFYERINLPYANYHFRKAIAIQPHQSTVHVNYANYSYTKLNDYKTATHHFKQALQIHEHNAVAHGMYAKFLRDIEKDYGKSEYHFKCSIDLNSNDPRALYQYAILLHYMKKLKLSRYYFEECIRTDTKRGNKPLVWHHYQYALVLKELKDYKNAIIELEYSLTLNHKISCIQYEYGLLLCENNQIDKGTQYLYTAYCNEPENQEYQHIFNKYKHANKQKQQANYRQYSVDYSPEYSSSSSEEEVNTFEAKITRGGRASPPPAPLNDNQIQQYNHNESTVSNVSNVNDTEVISETKESENINRNVLDNNSDMVRCEMEFERWFRNKMAGNTGDLYYNKFKELEYNDIRLLEHFDTMTLANVISNKLHIKMFEKQINKFKKDMGVFGEWFSCIGLHDEYYDKFESSGILTFEAFYHYMNAAKDIEIIIGEKNKNDALYMWNSTPKHSRRIEDKILEKEGKTI
eukprot:222919_1